MDNPNSDHNEAPPASIVSSDREVYNYEMNSAQVKERVAAYVNKAYASALVRVNAEYDEKVASLREQLGSKGLSRSSVMERDRARLSAEKVRTLIQSRADAAIEAYEMYGTLDQEAAACIVEDATEVRSTIIAALKGAAVHQAQMKASVAGMDGFAGALDARNFSKEVDHLSTPILNEIACQLERRRHMAPRNAESSKTTNVYHVYGHNPHWNFNSQDHSVNTVTVTNDQLFAQMKELISAEVLETEERAALLGRLEALQQSQNTPSFSHRYTEFIASAANHMGLIAPFIPALTEILQKALA